MNEEQQKKILPDDHVRFELTQLIPPICYDLMQMYDEASYPPYFDRRKAIPWSFGENSARTSSVPFVRTAIKPFPRWDQSNERWIQWEDMYKDPDWTMQDWINTVLKADPCEDWEIKTQNIYFQWLYSHTRNGCNAVTCLGIKSEFLTYMIPKITDISRKIRENFVDAVTWESALVAYRGGGNKQDASGSNR